MNEGTAIAGGILMVLGFVIFMIGYPTTQDPLWRYGQLYSIEAREQYAIAWIMTLVGGGMAVGGLALLIYGVSAKPSSEEDIENYVIHTRKRDSSMPSQRLVQVVCPHCRTSHLLKENAKFCPNCGGVLPTFPAKK